MPSDSHSPSTGTASSSSSASYAAINGGSPIRSARLERKTWIMAIAIFTAVVVMTGSAPYYLSTRSLVSSTSSSSTTPALKKASSKPLYAQNHVNGSWEDELRMSLGIEKCIKPEAKWVIITIVYQCKELTVYHRRGYHPNKKIPWTVFTSYPRSGNTHLRNLVEQSSG